MKKTSYTWCIFYLDNKYWTMVNKELKDKGYKDIKAVIPTLSILKKRQKGKDIIEEVPILFNYGFIRIPTEKAYSRPFLNKLKKQIIGIHSFVKSLETMHSRKLRKRIDNAEDFDDFSIVASVPYEEVRRFKRLAKKNKIYTKKEITSLKIGSYVTLRGYPFEGINATVEDINLTTNKITLVLYPESGRMVVKLPFDNVVYSIYHNYDENKLYANQRDFNPNQISAESINNIMDIRQY